jgi:hypothetical protein
MAQAIRAELLAITDTLQKQLMDLRYTYSAQSLAIRNDVDRLASRVDDLIRSLQTTAKKSPAAARQTEKRKESPSKSGTR